IRGLRIELGEIESVLSQHDDVESAVVVVREDTPGDKRLVAYCTGLSDVDGLRDLCQQCLPDYMVPSGFVLLDELPLTRSGKLDRRALPAPERPDFDDGYIAPRGDLETLVAEIWTDVLGVDKVGMHDNFFALGGHSLLATRVVNRVDLLTGLRIDLKQFF